MGKTIGALFFIGGCLVLRALMFPSPHAVYMAIGLLFLLAALVIFIREIRKI